MSALATCNEGLKKMSRSFLLLDLNLHAFIYLSISWF